jgi:hypothetical protein
MSVFDVWQDGRPHETPCEAKKGSFNLHDGEAESTKNAKRFLGSF